MDKRHWSKPFLLLLFAIVLLVCVGCEEVSDCQKPALEVRKLTPTERGKHPVGDDLLGLHWWVVTFPVDPPPQGYTALFDFRGDGSWVAVSLEAQTSEKKGTTRFGIPAYVANLYVQWPGVTDPNRWLITWPPPCK